MKASEAERITEDFSISGDMPLGSLSHTQAGARAQPNSTTASKPKRPAQVKVMARSNWPLPAPPSDANAESGIARRQSRQSRRETIDLSHSDMEVLAALHARCKHLGIKIKKTKLLIAALQLLNDAPTGKLLAVLGPHESTDNLFKPKRKKAPIRA